MANIKVKESKKGTIKTLNKAVIGTEKMKNRIVETKEKINETNQNSEDNSTNYAINKITTTTQNTIEGNSSDSCRQRDYDINSFEIQGYGTPAYQ